MAKNKFFGRCYPTRPELPHSTVLEDTEDGGGYYHWSSPGEGAGGYRGWWWVLSLSLTWGRCWRIQRMVVGITTSPHLEEVLENTEDGGGYYH